MSDLLPKGGGMSHDVQPSPVTATHSAISVIDD